MRLLLTRLCLLACLSLVSFCEVNTKKDSQPQTQTAKAPATKDAKDFHIMIYGEDENIFVLPPAYAELNSQKDSDLFLTVQADKLGEAAVSAFSSAIHALETGKTTAIDARSPAPELALVREKPKAAAHVPIAEPSAGIGDAEAPRPGKTSSWTRAFADTFQKAWQGRNPASKVDYFLDAVRKRGDDDPQFHRMEAVRTRIVPSLALPPDAGDQVRLGVLPNREILYDLRQGIRARDGSTIDGNFDILSVVQNFELAYAKAAMLRQGAGGALPSRGELIEQLAAEEAESNIGYTIPVDIDGTMRQLGVTNWTQLSTPDRRMMTEPILAAGIDALMAAMRAGRPILVHCKSGKGRSATVVVGARAALLIDAARAHGIMLTKTQVDDLIEEQTAQVKSVRPLISINLFQKYTIKHVLYARAGIPP